MGKRIRDTNLESRAGRSKLKPRGKPYYKAIGEGLHLGYRKGQTEGKWVVRRYVGHQDYKVETIAVADDISDADGERVLTFWQAQERAREIGDKIAYSGPYRVRDAVEDYLSHLDAEGRGWEPRSRANRHILPALGDLHIAEITADVIRKWHRGMVRNGARASQASANRVLTILKAALNRSFREGRASSDAEWRRVEPFKKVDAARLRYLTIAECQRLLNACDPRFRPVVRGALETGARYGELCRMVCGDYNPDAGTIHILKSKTGKERHIILSEDGRSFFDDLTIGRSTDEPVFGHQWKRDNQTFWMKRAVAAAKINPPISFHGLRHTWASLSVMGGMPLMIVARNLGHVDTRMVERHYGHLAPSYVVDQVRKFAPRFGKVPSSNVRAL